jgi:hypothetical protein
VFDVPAGIFKSHAESQPRPFRWTGTSERAAFLLAEDLLTDAAIAESVRISTATLYRWKADPEFAARIDQLADEIQKRVRREGFGRLDRRLKRYTERLDAERRSVHGWTWELKGRA